jgi:serine beta-lactamase-like protein LACTB, mitochondrial
MLRALIISLLLPGVVVAQHARADSLVEWFMAEHHVPGLAIGVVVNGEVGWTAGYGMADLENFAPVTPETLFRLGSMSKSLTATAAMQLWERGKLDLDAPIQRYCPLFPAKPWPITTRELLGHLGGIRHYKGRGEADPEIGNTKHFADGIAAGIAFFAADTLVARPGTKFHYSTMGYTLVGCAVAHASGQAYADYMRENVFLPAGMDHTQVDDRFAIVPYRTRFYETDSTGQVVNADFLDASYKVPGGGWLSSADDITRFIIAFLHDTFVKRSTRTLMWSRQRTTLDSLTGYGLGFGIGYGTCQRCVGHSGGQQGTSTLMVIEPDQRAGVVILSNLEDLSLEPLANEILASAGVR